jgi:hypothetical protein
VFLGQQQDLLQSCADDRAVFRCNNAAGVVVHGNGFKPEVTHEVSYASSAQAEWSYSFATPASNWVPAAAKKSAKIFPPTRDDASNIETTTSSPNNFSF